MSTPPTPRSYSAILGQLLDAFLSRTGLPNVRVNSPHLAILEAAAQSDLRSSKDIFQLLGSISLDQAQGVALDRLAADEGTARFGQSPATGYVTFGDSTITKISTILFRGKPSPIVGSDKIYVSDATDFPASGQIYIGRGTNAYEGPLSYTSKTSYGSYWSLNLAGGNQTTFAHNYTDTVILAQGGDRTIPAGTTVNTSLGNASTAIQFTTDYVAVIPDGEVSLAGVAVTATIPGITGNVIAGSIVNVTSTPFVGLTVTNPTPFTNGLPSETDEQLRARIRALRQSRARGTPLAIKTNVLGVSSTDEGKRVTSVSYVSADKPTLYIDDGTGYEEQDRGISYESLVDSAVGGEQYFQLVHGRPVTKAYVESLAVAPYGLSDGAVLAVEVGGVYSVHSFSADEFRSIAGASAYEVVASINANSGLLFSARTTGGGSRVQLVAKADTNESIQVLSSQGTDSNSVFLFPVSRADTLVLYKNDLPLTKDGSEARILSAPQSQWGAVGEGATIVVTVDDVSIGSNTYSITAADFVNAGTGYLAVSASNSLEAWATVLERKIPGITASVLNGQLLLVSNRGRQPTASIAITGGDMVNAGIFAVQTVTGASNDYTLDRNLGQIRLEIPLAGGDKLTAGSNFTRGFVEFDLATTPLSVSGLPTTVTGESGWEWWFVVDGDVVLRTLNIGTGTAITTTGVVVGSNTRVTYTAPVATFSGAEAGDWAIVNDSNLDVANRGAFRIDEVATDGSYITVLRPSASWVAESVSLAFGGIYAFSSTREPQRAYIPAVTATTPSTIIASVVDQLVGVNGVLAANSVVRAASNTYPETGSLALVASNNGLEQHVVPNSEPHAAAVQASNGNASTPSFTTEYVATATDANTISVTSIGSITSEKLVSGAATYNTKHQSAIEVISGTGLELRSGAVKEWLVGSYLYSHAPFAIGPADGLTVVMDGDVLGRRYSVNMYRKVKPTTTTYGLTNYFYDHDNADASLAQTFGLGMSFADYAVYMKARTKSHLSGGVDTTKTILWRYGRLGAEGNNARIQYVYPAAANSTASIAASATTSDNYVDITVTLPSGAARTGVTYTNAAKVGYLTTSGPDANGLYTHVAVMNLAIASGTRQVRLAYSASSGTLSPGDTVTGTISGATATVTDVVLGSIGISPISGAWIVGENADNGLGAYITLSRAPYGYTILTLTLPAGVTRHGFATGNQLHVQYNSTGTTAGFNTSAPTVSITAVSNTEIAYTDVATAIAATASIGTVSFDTVEASTAASTVAVGDVFVHTGQTSFKLATLTGGYFTGKTEALIQSGTTLNWRSIGSTTNLSWFTVGDTAANIATTINGLNSPIASAVAVGAAGVATGVIDAASYEDITGTDHWYYLSDGVNYVRSNTNPVLVTDNYSLTFKNAVTASLASNSDWQNEDVRLVPITTQGVVDYLSSNAANGLGTADVSISDNRPQIATDTLGTDGSVEVQGGNANSTVANLQGSGVAVGTYGVVSVPTSEADGLRGGFWVRAQNTSSLSKSRFDSTTVLQSWAADGTATLSGTLAWEHADTSATTRTAVTTSFYRQGAFLMVEVVESDNCAGVSEGDWVRLNGYTVNNGIYSVVRTEIIDATSYRFWIESADGLEKLNDTGDLTFVTYSSIMPGDTLNIGVTNWGANNVGEWVVSSIDWTNTSKFVVDVSNRAPDVVASPATALGSSYPLVILTEAKPRQLIKQIHTISPNEDTSLVDIKLTTSAGIESLTEAAGTSLSAMDKLAFPTGVVTGVDAYRHSTGLIEEANKVAYGLESDPDNYPGVVAAGVSVNIEGPLVHRVQVSVGIRRLAVSLPDLIAQVKSAVAGVVNSAGVGQSIAISDIIAAVQSVNGVEAVTFLSPLYGTGSDLIEIQPYEKPLVLNLDEDVLVSSVGE